MNNNSMHNFVCPHYLAYLNDLNKSYRGEYGVEARPLDIYIKNNTNQTYTFDHSGLWSGISKSTNDTGNTTLAPGATHHHHYTDEMFEGPAGFVVYKSPDLKYVNCFFEHPFGSNASSYYTKVDPWTPPSVVATNNYGGNEYVYRNLRFTSVYSYYTSVTVYNTIALSVTGHDQSVTFTIS